MSKENNKYSKLVQSVFDELGIVSEAVDESSVGWLQAHDDRYHGGHYEPTQRCQLRERLGSDDESDRLEGGGTAAEALANAPSPNEMYALIMRLKQDGSITAEEADEIERMGRRAVEVLQNADDENAVFGQEERNNLLALNEIYHALNDAFPQGGGEERHSESAESEGDGEAGEGGGRGHEEQRTEEPRQPDVVAESPEGETEASGGANSIMGMSEEFTYQDYRNLHNKPYEWPFNRRNPVSAEALTPEMLRGIAMNLPYGVRSSWRIQSRAEDAIKILKDPSAVDRSYRCNGILEKMASSSNRDAKRYMAALEALHPGWYAERHEREAEARRQREHGANNRRIDWVLAECDTVPHAPSVNDEEFINISSEDAEDAVNRLVLETGLEERRSDIQRAMETFRSTGVVPSGATNFLNNNLPHDHPVIVAIREANRRRNEARGRRHEEAIDFRPVVSEDTKRKEKELAEKFGIEFAETPITGIAPKRYGYNCYLAAIVHSLRRAGFKIGEVNARPSGYGGDSQQYFLPLKNAMSDAGWEPVQGKTREDTVANLERLANTKPNGYTIECWSNSWHGSHAFLKDGKWYYTDPWNHADTTDEVYQAVEMNSNELANFIKPVDEDKMNLDSMSDENRRKAYALVMKGLDPIQRRSMTQAQKDEIVNRKLKEMGIVAESSFGHSPEQGFTEEIVKQVLR